MRFPTVLPVFAFIAISAGSTVDPDGSAKRRGSCSDPQVSPKLEALIRDRNADPIRVQMALLEEFANDFGLDAYRQDECIEERVPPTADSASTSESPSPSTSTEMAPSHSSLIDDATFDMVVEEFSQILRRASSPGIDTIPAPDREV
jgi:hypothetical protein